MHNYKQGTEEATRLFGLLSQNSETYRMRPISTWDIDYANSSYTTALQHFERLRNHPEYQEEVAFYTARELFDGKIDDAIRLSEASCGEHQTNVPGLGNSHRLGQPSAIPPASDTWSRTRFP